MIKAPGAPGARRGTNMKTAQGFTLIELMIAVAVVAILGAIAWPMWQDYIMRSHRTAAKACLLEQSQYMERFYTQNMSYATSRDGDDVALPDGGCAAEQAEYYTFSIADVDDTSYTLEAEPQGTQATRDTACGTLGVDQTGAKTKSGEADVSKCW